MSLTNTQHTSTDPAATRALGHDGRAGRRRVSNGSPTQVLRSVTAALLAAAREVDEASTARDLQAAGRFLHHCDPSKWCDPDALSNVIAADQIAAAIITRRRRSTLSSGAAAHVRTAENLFRHW